MHRAILFVVVIGLTFPAVQSFGQTQRAPFPRRPIGTLAETGMSSNSSRRVALATHYETTSAEPEATNGASEMPPRVLINPSPLKPMIKTNAAPALSHTAAVEPVAAPALTATTPEGPNSAPPNQVALPSQTTRTMALRTKLSAPETTMVKQPTCIQVEVTNDGAEASDSAILRVCLPGHIRVDGCEPVASSCRDGVHEFTLEPLASNASCTIALQVCPQSCEPMQVKTEILMVARQEIGVQVARPKVEVQIAAPVQSYQNSMSNYTIQIRNPSPVELTGIRIQATLPEGMEVISAGAAASAIPANRVVSWTIDSLPAGRTETVECSATARQTGTQECQVTVESVEAEPVSVQAATIVSARSNLKIDMCCENAQVQVGETAELKIVLENRGTDTARDVIMQIELPAGLQAIPCEDYRIDAGRMMFQAIEVAAGETRTQCVKCTGTGAGEHVVRAQFKSATQRAIAVEDTVFVYEAGAGQAQSLDGNSSTK